MKAFTFRVGKKHVRGRRCRRTGTSRSSCTSALRHGGTSRQGKCPFTMSLQKIMLNSQTRGE